MAQAGFAANFGLGPQVLQCYTVNMAAQCCRTNKMEALSAQAKKSTGCSSKKKALGAQAKKALGAQAKKSTGSSKALGAQKHCVLKRQREAKHCCHKC